MEEIHKDMICHVLAGIHGSRTADQRISSQKGQFMQQMELQFKFSEQIWTIGTRQSFPGEFDIIGSNQLQMEIQAATL